MPNRNAGHIDEMTPVASGTRRLAERFCESLVCVRYRENPARGLHYVPAGRPKSLAASILSWLLHFDVRANAAR